MNHAELSRDLAIALGYHPESVRADEHDCNVYGEWDEFGPRWRVLDYRSPRVALPLLKWLGIEYRKFFWFCAPTSSIAPRWACSGNGIIANTLEEAIARACIALKGKP